MGLLVGGFFVVVVVEGVHVVAALGEPEPADEVLGVAAALVVVVQHPRRPVLLGHPHLRVGRDVAHQLHHADPHRDARRREQRVHLHIQSSCTHA